MKTALLATALYISVLLAACPFMNIKIPTESVSPLEIWAIPMVALGLMVVCHVIAIAIISTVTDDSPTTIKP
jgi:hypothetical protein